MRNQQHGSETGMDGVIGSRFITLPFALLFMIYYMYDV